MSEYANYVEQAAYEDGLAKGRAECEALRNLLKVAACPANCVNGVIEKGAYQHPSGQIEYDIEQCQFCDERHNLLEQEDE